MGAVVFLPFLADQCAQYALKSPPFPTRFYQPRSSFCWSRLMRSESLGNAWHISVDILYTTVIHRQYELAAWYHLFFIPFWVNFTFSLTTKNPQTFGHRSFRAHNYHKGSKKRGWKNPWLFGIPTEATLLEVGQSFVVPLHSNSVKVQLLPGFATLKRRHFPCFGGMGGWELRWRISPIFGSKIFSDCFFNFLTTFFFLQCSNQMSVCCPVEVKSQNHGLLWIKRWIVWVEQHQWIGIWLSRK